MSGGKVWQRECRSLGSCPEVTSTSPWPFGCLWTASQERVSECLVEARHLPQSHVGHSSLSPSPSSCLATPWSLFNRVMKNSWSFFRGDFAALGLQAVVAHVLVVTVQKAWLVALPSWPLVIRPCVSFHISHQLFGRAIGGWWHNLVVTLQGGR